MEEDFQCPITASTVTFHERLLHSLQLLELENIHVVDVCILGRPIKPNLHETNVKDLNPLYKLKDILFLGF